MWKYFQPVILLRFPVLCMCPCFGGKCSILIKYTAPLNLFECIVVNQYFFFCVPLDVYEKFLLSISQVSPVDNYPRTSVGVNGAAIQFSFC